MTAECLMTNCRKKAPKDEAMCSEHRNPPPVEKKTLHETMFEEWESRSVKADYPDEPQ